MSDGKRGQESEARLSGVIRNALPNGYALSTENRYREHRVNQISECRRLYSRIL